MADSLTITLSNISDLDLDFESIRGEQPEPWFGLSLFSSVFASLLFHGAAIATFLAFSVDSYFSPVAPVETVQIHFLPVKPVFVQDTLIAPEETETAQTTTAASAEDEAIIDSIIDPAINPPNESMKDSIAEQASEAEVEPRVAQRVVPTVEPTVELPEESQVPRPVVELDAEPSLPSIVSIRKTLAGIESEFGVETWVNGCSNSSTNLGIADKLSHGFFEECPQAEDRDYSAADRNPMYDGLNSVAEPVSRSRRTVPLLASQRRSIATQLASSNADEENRDLVLRELDNGVNTYYGNHRKVVQNLQIMARQDPAAALTQQVFSPDILHWSQSRKMASP